LDYKSCTGIKNEVNPAMNKKKRLNQEEISPLGKET
jgi:hypothetical protein